ncbi:hypothetical protein GQ42DRAFT_118853, partial [Ramicandelaber brevisporus]
MDDSAPIQLLVTIEYVLCNQVPNADGGLVFTHSVPGDESSPSWAYVASPAVLPGGARHWIPCVDTAQDVCTWDITIIAPKHLASVESDASSELIDVACSGRKVRSAEHPLDKSSKMVHSFTVDVPMPASALSFAVGQLTQYSVGNSDLVTVYAPAGMDSDVQATCFVVPQILEYYAREYGSFPFSGLSLVFAPIILFNSSFLHGPSAIDQIFDTRRALAVAIGEQYFGRYIVVSTSSDAWLILGLARYIACEWYRHHCGNNEAKYRLRRDILGLVEMDINGISIGDPQMPHPLPQDALDLACRKGYLVLHIINRRMNNNLAKSNTAQSSSSYSSNAVGLVRIVSKTLVSALSGDLVGSSGLCLTTQWFMRCVRKLGQLDLRNVIDEWVLGSGCPRFKIVYSFSRKRLSVEIRMRQHNTTRNTFTYNAAAITKDGTPTLPIPALNDKVGIGANLGEKQPTLFTGSITAQIREADGTPYEHVLGIQDVLERYELPYNTKYKRVRRQNRRPLPQQSGADWSIPQVGMESDDERRLWRIVEFATIPSNAAIGAGVEFEYFRFDPDQDWVCDIDFSQPDFMWAAILDTERDVPAQLDAIRALEKVESPAASTVLLRTVLDSRYFYRVRMAAALALAHQATPGNDMIGLHHLMMIYGRMFCVPP